MNNLLTSEESDLIGLHYMPAVSIMLPFNPKMCLKSEIEHKLKLISAEVIKQLRAEFPEEKALPVIEKLTRVVRNLNFNTHKKSIAIFVSPVIEKVFYLDISVEEKIVVDETFEIRDLILNKKATCQYLVLILSSEKSRMYLAQCASFMLIKSNLPDNAYAYKRDLPEKTTHFSDSHALNEILLDSFMHHMDEGLSIVLKAYPLPVFVIGTKKVLGHFKGLTKNEKSIIKYIYGNFSEANEPVLGEVMKPYLNDWKKIQDGVIIKEIEKARDINKLVTGIRDVWSASAHKNGKLLIVENNYTCPPSLAGNADKIQIEDKNTKKPFYIKDAVDDIIENILDGGGDVEFVENGMLEKNGHIALIKFY